MMYIAQIVSRLTCKQFQEIVASVLYKRNQPKIHHIIFPFPENMDWEPSRHFYTANSVGKDKLTRSFIAHTRTHVLNVFLDKLTFNLIGNFKTDT